MESPADRLTTLLTGGPRDLDRVMAVIAAIDDDPPTEDGIVARLDELAEGLGSTSTPERVIAHVYGELGFAGNTADYYSPANSLVHRVLSDRVGIPLTLAAVGVEIGRRAGVELTIVGLPGHVVVGDGPQPERWFDPFAGGAVLELDDCRLLFARFNPIETFDTDMVRPIGPALTTSRMLMNLKLAYGRLGNLGQMARVLELAVSVPGAPVSQRDELATVLAALGRDDQAAAQREALVTLDPVRADRHRAAARNHRARRN